MGLSAGPAKVFQFEEVVPTRSRLRRWPLRILIFLLCLWLLDVSVTLLIRHTSLQNRITARLAAAFGRPVEVGHYNFSLWTGPLLEAEAVTVGEDPRFGSEYFVRAESLDLRIRWKGLLRGRLELGTISLNQPSLNVVRNAAGDWNLTEWLPRPNQRRSSDASNGTETLRFDRIAVDGGRVNFKAGDDKSAFALTGVDGTVEPDGAGRWFMNLEATPWRASSLTQQAGEIQITGHVGGTSSRLLPALLDFSWTGASIPDALRLARGEDSGVRGNLALTATAQTTNGVWDVQARAEMRQIHRWNLALRPDNPDLNLLARMKVNPQAGDLELTSATLEAPHSNAHLAGRVGWETVAGIAGAEKKRADPDRVEITDSAIDLADVFAWFHAFHGGASDRITVRGAVAASGTLTGWPPKIEKISVQSDGAELLGSGVNSSDPVHIGPVDLRYDRDSFTILPVMVWLGVRQADPTGTFHMDAAYKPGSNRPASVRVTGNSVNIGEVTGLASTLGWNFSHGWDLRGPFRCDLRWQGPIATSVPVPSSLASSVPLLAPWPAPWNVLPVGFVELGDKDDGEGFSVGAPFLNQPIRHVKARMELKPGARHVLVSSADAFGATWTGTFDRREPDRRWKFALVADHLAVADLDRWFNPRWRETLIDRVLPFLNSRSPVNATPDLLQGEGSIAVNEFAVAPFQLENVRSEVEFNGRHVEVTNVAAKFYGGEVRGSAVADVKGVPVYRSALDFSGVDLAAMTALSPQLADLFAGSASGEISFVTRGLTRTDLMASLECDGAASVEDAEFHGINLEGAMREGAMRDVTDSAGVSTFTRVSARFTCGDRKVQFQDLRLAGSRGEREAVGLVDFNRSLDFRIWATTEESSAVLSKTTAAPTSEAGAFRLSGTLAAPEVSPIPTATRRLR